MAVYFVRNAVTGNIKIGKADDPEARVRDLQVANDCPLEILLVVEGDQADECLLHQRFAHLRIRGEWFLDDTELLAFIAEAAKAQKGRRRLFDRRGRLNEPLADSMRTAYLFAPKHNDLVLEERECPCTLVRALDDPAADPRCVCEGRGRVLVPVREEGNSRTIGWARVNVDLRDRIGALPPNALLYLRNA